MAEREGKIKRKLFITMLNVAPEEETASYHLLGNGVTEHNIQYNPQSSSETYIHEETASTETDSYKITAPVSAKAFAGDMVFSFIDRLRRQRAVGFASKTDVVNVFLYAPIEGEEGVYEAERQPVSVQIDSYGGVGGEDLTINYTLNYMGDCEPGRFNIESKEFSVL